MRSLPTVQTPPITVTQEPVILQRFTPEFENLRTPISNLDPQLSSSSMQRDPIPNSWSSINELLNGSQINYTSSQGNESTIIQKLSSSSEPSNFLDFDNLVSQKMPVEDASSSNLISAFNENNPAQQVAQIEEIPSTNDSSVQENDRDLEVLAREIYTLLRQRLEIDRERRGSYYSDRLPW